ncbi:hypothetical protein Q5530_08710 [Saccharothrix sp. BKS2]|uniref:hypothetical protein n=1 Tax=Saccharothrix sp. BKS2 TaxID=3064400 RepID=UPI0039EBD999
MTEPVPERTSADAATGTPPAAGGRAAEQPPAEQPSAPREPDPAEPLPGTTGAGQAAPVEQPPAGRGDAAAPTATGEPSGTGTPTGTGDPTDTGDPTTAGAFGQAGADPHDLLGTLSLADIEADIDRLMTEKMSELDGMLAGLEELVQRLEGEITHLEPPRDDTTTP